MLTELPFRTEETSFCGKVPATVAIRKYSSYGYYAVVVTDPCTGAITKTII